MIVCVVKGDVGVMGRYVYYGEVSVYLFYLGSGLGSGVEQVISSLPGVGEGVCAGPFSRCTVALQIYRNQYYLTRQFVAPTKV